MKNEMDILNQENCQEDFNVRVDALVIPQRRSLFGVETIKSISFDERELIQNILDLHCGGQEIDCDPTYSIGNFYKGRPKPKYKFDIKPVKKGVVKASADKKYSTHI